MIIRNIILITTLVFSSLYANKKYCSDITDKQRTTTIYLDLSNTNEKKFAQDLLRELSNNFLPHERIQVFTINPNDVTIKQVYNSCVPKLSIKEIKKVKNEGSFKYMLGGNPIDAAKEDYSFFMAELKNTLVKVFKNSIDENPEKKELVELLYSESSIFQQNPLQRVILYSDMNQNSSQLSLKKTFEGEALNKNLLKEYKVNFNYAEFYIYTGKKRFNITNHNKLIEFWKNYIELNNGHVKYFNDSLKLAKFQYQINNIYEGKLTVEEKEYEAKMYLGYNEKKQSVNSWFIINEIESIPLKGKVNIVNGKLNKGSFAVASINRNNHSLFVGDEKFQLNFNNKKLNGRIKIDNAEVVLNGKKINNPVFDINMKKVIP